MATSTYTYTVAVTIDDENGRGTAVVSSEAGEVASVPVTPTKWFCSGDMRLGALILMAAAKEHYGEEN